MKKLILLAGFTAFASSAYCQKDSMVTISKDTFRHIEIEAKVDAGQWKRHLENNLQSVLDRAAKKGMRYGTYTVNIRFLIEKDGSITDVKAINDLGYGVTSAVEKIVQSGPHWTPGSIDGKPVRSYHTQPITFQITK